MNGQQRREEIKKLLLSSSEAISGAALAKEYGVSRQVIVQDIALLRANGLDIISTNHGYVLQSEPETSRVFKVQHTTEEALDELFLFVDFGGTVKDVFIFHKVYGTVRAELDISSRQDARDFMDTIASGKSSLLMNVTDGYHYHTIVARNEEVLDRIQEELQKKGFLAKLQDYEPVNFWKSE